MQSKEEIRELFRDLFTHTEYKMFAKRLEIARLLLKGENYEEIIRQAAFSEKTIAHVSNILSSRGDGLRNADKRLSKIDKEYLKNASKRQDILERRVRPKMVGETVLQDLRLIHCNTVQYYSIDIYANNGV